MVNKDLDNETEHLSNILPSCWLSVLDTCFLFVEKNLFKWLYESKTFDLGNTTYTPDFYFVEAEIGEDPDKRDYVISNAKIEATGFMPNYSLHRSIAELIKGYQIIKRNQFANI